MTTSKADLVTARLRRLAELSKTVPRTPRLDYGAEAVTARLREMSELSQFCARLVELGRIDRARR
jgi:hypothetical protein